MSDKRILLFIDGLGSGGAERQLVGLAVMLKGHGYDVSVLCYKPGADFYADTLLDNGVEYLNIHKGPFAGLQSLYKKIRQWHPDCVISYLNQSNMVACACRMITKVPLIVSERNTISRQRLIDRLRFWLYRWSAAIVSNSYSQTDFVTSYYPAYKDRAYAVTNFVDTDTFHPAATPLADPSSITVVARITPQKNVIGLIRSIAELKKRNQLGDIHVQWYGAVGDQAYYQECRATIDQLGIEAEFRFMGVTNDVASLYRSSAVLCLPSFREGTPNVIAEAMASGLPVLCSDVCDNARYVTDGVNGFLFDPDSIDSITGAILRYTRLSPEERKAMGEANRKAALDNFSSDRFVDSYISLIDKYSK